MKSALAHLVGDYVVQNDHMTREKTAHNGPAAAHAITYAACFLPLTRSGKALLVIGGTHYLIDRYRLAKYVVWARNQVGPREARYSLAEAGPFADPPDRPAWLAGWLLFIADNTMHLLINEWALKRWTR